MKFPIFWQIEDWQLAGRQLSKIGRQLLLEALILLA
jgi:hypothetical protein